MKWQSLKRVALFFLLTCVAFFIFAGSVGLPIGAHYLGVSLSYTTPVNCTVISEFDCYKYIPTPSRGLKKSAAYWKCYYHVDVFYGSENNRSARIAGPDDWPMVFSDVHTCYLNDADHSYYKVSFKYRDDLWKSLLSVGIIASFLGVVFDIILVIVLRQCWTLTKELASQGSPETIPILRARIDSRGAIRQHSIRLHSDYEMNNL